MDRLEQEWKETHIPEEACLRARNAAWARLQGPKRVRPALIWATAASMLIIAASVVWMRIERETQLNLVSVPAKPNVIAPEKAAIRIAELPAEEPTNLPPKSIAAQREQIKKIRPRRQAPIRSAAPAEPERVVLNMILPETGARMIWIMDSSFHF